MLAARRPTPPAGGGASRKAADTARRGGVANPEGIAFRGGIPEGLPPQGIDKYFIKYPLRSAKASRVNLIKDFYNLRLYQNSEDLNKLNL